MSFRKVISNLSGLRGEGAMINGELKSSGAGFFVFAMEGQITAMKRRKKFIEENGYRSGLKVEDKNTGIKGEIKEITSNGEIVVSGNGNGKIKMNPLNTKIFW